MINIQAIEKSIMTTTDEKMLEQMAETMPFDIYQQLSSEARSRLAKAYGKEVPASSPYTGVLPMKKAHRKLTEKERDRMIHLWASAPATYIPDVDDELMKLGLIRFYDEERTAVEHTEVTVYDASGRILPEWYDFGVVRESTTEMKTIWKYPLSIVNDQWIDLPLGAKLLSVQIQAGQPQLWAIVTPELPIEKRHIRIYGTGHRITGVENLEYISSFQMKGGALVFHVFEVIED